MNKYKGIFNWFGQDFTLYTHAHSPDGAFLNLCRQLGEKVGYSPRRVRNRFMNSTHYEIKEA